MLNKPSQTSSNLAATWSSEYAAHRRHYHRHHHRRHHLLNCLARTCERVNAYSIGGGSAFPANLQYGILAVAVSQQLVVWPQNCCVFPLILQW
jgi:hypothetical protein